MTGPFDDAAAAAAGDVADAKAAEVGRLEQLAGARARLAEMTVSKAQSLIDAAVEAMERNAVPGETLGSSTLWHGPEGPWPRTVSSEGSFVLVERGPLVKQPCGETGAPAVSARALPLTYVGPLDLVTVPDLESHPARTLLASNDGKVTVVWIARGRFSGSFVGGQDLEEVLTRIIKHPRSRAR